MNSFHRREEPFEPVRCYSYFTHASNSASALLAAGSMAQHPARRELVGYPLGCRFLPSLLQLHLLSVPQR